MGTVPDLDVLTSFFVSASTQLGWHRGFSHSALFATLAAPVFGWIIYRIHRRGEAGWRDWSWLVFWAILTHPILDMFTVYGTQFLQPFSDYPVAFNSIFIIDLLYTVPLFLGVAIAQIYHRSSRRRIWINRLGLILSSGYLLWGIGVKFHVNDVVTDALTAQDKQFQRYMTAPTPLNSLLWMAIAEDKNGYWIGLYSLLDPDRQINFRYIERREELLTNYHGPALEQLNWFSRGYYIARSEHGQLYYRDIRFGRLDGWLEENGNYIFNFRLISSAEDGYRIVDFAQERPSAAVPDGAIAKLVSRVGGNRSVEYQGTDARQTGAVKPSPTTAQDDDIPAR